MGLPVPFPGRPLEGHGNVAPREMAVQPVSRKRPVNRTRRISRPARTEPQGRTERLGRRWGSPPIDVPCSVGGE